MKHNVFEILLFNQKNRTLQHCSKNMNLKKTRKKSKTIIKKGNNKIIVFSYDKYVKKEQNHFLHHNDKTI